MCTSLTILQITNPDLIYKGECGRISRSQQPHSDGS